MAGQGFDINVTTSEVLVKWDGSPSSGSTRGMAGFWCILGSLLLLARLFLEVVRTLTDRHSSFDLHSLIAAASKARGATLVLLLFEAGLLIPIGFLFLVGMRLFFPGGEQIQCDRTTFTYSKIPFVSLRGRWKRTSFPVTDVSELMYGVIKFGDSSKNTPDTYGISFFARDKEYKAFAGLEAGDADEIVKQLRVLGIDVIVNQDMTKLIEAKSENRDSIFSNNYQSNR
jgi:hypothetical protein